MKRLHILLLWLGVINFCYSLEKHEVFRTIPRIQPENEEGVYEDFFQNLIARPIFSEDEPVFLFPSEILTRSLCVSDEQLENMSDAYLEGYIQALIDVHYYEFKIIVYVADGYVYLANLPRNKLLFQSIVAFVRGLPGVQCVKVTTRFSDKILDQKEEYESRPCIKGTWFPQQTVSFQPILGDPWEPMYSAAFRLGNKRIGSKVIAVSYGDTFPIFRWYNVGKRQGALQIDVQAGAWSVFKMNPKHDFSELKNTDYLIGIPLSYAIGRWSFRLRAYHISCHLGDEFMVNHCNYKRKNPSMEAIDFYSSCQMTSGIRLYFGPGVIVHSDPSFPMDPLYFQYGGEFRFFGNNFYYHGLYGTCLFVVNFRHWQTNHWQFDFTTQIGYEWSKLQGVGRKMRIFLEYHNGYSEGQFFKDRTQYGAIRLSWGF